MTRGLGTGLALAMLAAFVAGGALSEDGYYDSHDGLLNIHRLFELERCVEDGQVPCRWVPDMGRGYGYPLFNFYPPLSTHLSLLFRALGAGSLDAVKWTMCLTLLLAASGMFVLATRFFGPRPGAVAAVLYTLAPYVAVDVYVRGALAETLGLALLPWVFACGERAVRGAPAATPTCAVAWGALLLAHPITALMATGPYALWLSVWLYRKARPARTRALLRLVGAHGLAIALAAWFVVPALAELRYVHAETLTALYPWARFENNFLSFSELAAVWPAWGYGPFRSSQGMALFLGPLQGLAVLAAAVGLVLRDRRTALDDAGVAAATLAGGGAAAAFMTLAVSQPVWELVTPLSWLQFPWRFLAIASFGTAFAGGWVVFALRARPRVAAGATAILCVAAISTSWTWFQPKSMHLVADEVLANRHEVAKTVHGLFDFLPAGVDLDHFRSHPPGIAPPPASSKTASIQRASRASNRIDFEAQVEGDAPALVRLESFSFPGWRVQINGEAASFEEVADPLGRLHVRLPPGRHRVIASFGNTRVRTLANLTSAIAVLVLLAWLVATLRTGLRREATAE